ncbi:hypothetical protein [Bradyrhizobium sp. BRP23]|uniref:hypothetical protein n=1 Tax=Bradyrhizobium sp. BRP23 TaxID=2793820 RepID=UPI001CD520A4|nr:hypothetical protein [Bradyrhizobium sp. BRP23]MCA1381292.1 hypothetical protein [Bradyrhizobium sp. BRP05]MCA1418588.1 hypothetical protein [Bradyrhizobium sp. BRP23]
MSGSGLAAVHLAAAATTTALQAPPMPPLVPAQSATAAAPATSVADLAAAYPDLCTQLRVEGATAERTRILAIEAAALPGHETLVASMKADPTVTADMAAGRLLNAEKQLRAGQLQAIKDVEGATGKVAAAPAGTATAKTEDPPKESAHQLAARARTYQDEQAKLGVKISVAQAVAHVEKNG